MAGKSNTSATFFAQKKLLGKANTSLLKTDGEELIGSNIQAASSQIFGQVLPDNPSQTLYLLQSASNGGPATVEYIHFQIDEITGSAYNASDTGLGAGSDAGESSQSSGPHSYKFRFRSDYESNSSNPKKGKGNFNNTKILHETLGKVQLVPPFFSQNAPNRYIVEIYRDNGSGGIGTKINLTDNIDWNVDYYNGILFIQDYDASSIPAHAKAFAYVGDFADKGFYEQGLSGSLTQLTDGSSYLVAGNNITISSASNGQVTIASSGGGGGGAVSSVANGANNRLTTFSSTDALNGEANLTFDGSTFSVTGNTSLNGSVTVNDDLVVSGSIIANEFHTMILSSSIMYRSGSTKFGDTADDTHHFTGSARFATGISGSLTNLADGTSYLVAGSNITIVSGSKGQITLASTNTTYTAGNGLDLGGTEFALDLKSGSGLVITSTELDINDSIIATISGSGFKGHVGVTGSLYSTTTISGSLLKGNYLTGSLTKLTDGKSYLVAGSNVTIASSSNGQVTISSTDTNTTYTAGDGLDLSTTTFSLDLKSGGGLKIDSTELSIEPNDFAGTGLMDDGSDNLKINDSIVATISGSGFKGHVGVTGSLYSTTTISGSLLKGNYLSGSLTNLSDGTSYLVAGSNITIASASNGQITISSTATGGGSAGPRAKKSYNISSLVASGSVFNTSTVSYTDAGFNPSLIDVFLNGQLMLSGTNSQVGQGEVDYFVHSDNQLKFGFDLQVDDVVNVVVSATGSGDAGNPGGTNTQVQFNDGGSLSGDSGLVFNKTTNTLTANNMSGSLTKLSDGTSYIVAGNSISIISQSNGSILISAPNSIFNEYIGEADGSNTRFTLDKTPTANKNVAVFVNGQLQMPATNITGAPFQDFSVTGSVIYFTTSSLPPDGSLLMANYTTNQSIS